MFEHTKDTKKKGNIHAILKPSLIKASMILKAVTNSPQASARCLLSVSILQAMHTANSNPFEC